MRTRTALPSLVVAAVTAGVVTLLAGVGPQTPPAQAPPQVPPRQPGEVFVPIVGEIGAPPRLAIADFVALPASGGGSAGTADKETAAVAQTITEVLWDDLRFEREFYLIPRDVIRTVPAPRGIDDVRFDRWREIGADGVIIGTVQKTANGLLVQARLLDVRSKASGFGKEYSGSAGNPRLYAHTIADEIHLQQRRLRGVARTKLVFASDRDGERIPGPVDLRTIKEIYFSDYDGAAQRRITITRNLNNFAVWSPDGNAVAYTSWRQGFPNIFVSYIRTGTHPVTPAGGNPTVHNWLAVFSPDGTRLAFTSNRNGNPELYVVNIDGTNLRRLTNHPAADTTPTWSPTGTEIAFISDRSGSPQVYVLGADGTGLRRITTSEAYCDRPTWSPAPFNEIAYAARTGPGNDIKIYEVATGRVRQLTFGEGTNESPAFAPNGRHLAFSTTRWGRTQIAVVARDGNDVRQITRDGNNFAPNWSR
jgi:TolB protein